MCPSSPPLRDQTAAWPRLPGLALTCLLFSTGGMFSSDRYLPNSWHDTLVTSGCSPAWPGPAGSHCNSDIPRGREARATPHALDT